MPIVTPAWAPTPERVAALRVERVTTLAALEHLQAEWEDLWRRDPRATPFQSPRWLVPWWKHVGRGMLSCLAVRAASGRLVALAPLYVHADASGCRHLFPLGIGTTDVLDLLVDPAWAADSLAVLGACLAHDACACDVLEFPQLDGNAWLLAMSMPEAWRRDVCAGEPSPALALRAQDAAASLPVPPGMLRNVRACQRRAARERTVTFTVADRASLPGWLETLTDLHGRRWSGRGEAGVLAEASVRAFHREAAPLLLEAGLLRLHGLCFDGEPAAALYVLADPPGRRERVHRYYIGGFDPRWAALSPGTLIVAQAIEAACREGAASFDFLRGAEPYKYRWGATDRATFTLRARQAPPAP